MACSPLTSGVALECNLIQSGGLFDVRIALFESVSADTATNFSVSAITMSPSAKYQSFEYPENSFKAFAIESAKINQENSSTFYEQTITFVIPKVQLTTIQALSLLAGRKLKLIAVDGNDKIRIYGHLKGVYATVIDSNTGTKRDDGSTITLTFVGMEPLQAPFVTSISVVDAVTD